MFIPNSFKSKFKKFKTMVAVIAFLLSLGIITSPDQATPDLIDQYQTQIVGGDVDAM